MRFLLLGKLFVDHQAVIKKFEAIYVRRFKRNIYGFDVVISTVVCLKVTDVNSGIISKII